MTANNAQHVPRALRVGTMHLFGLLYYEYFSIHRFCWDSKRSSP